MAASRHPWTAAVVLLGGGVVAAAGEPRITGSWAVPPAPLSAGVVLGGLSDLASVRSDGSLQMWTVTDRGPNGKAKVEGRKVRTLLAPDFVPALVRLRLDGQGGDAVVEEIVPLRGEDGTPLSGRPPGTDRLVAEADRRPVADDPRGVDPEGLAVGADDTWWIADEYRPALLHVDRGGRVLGRFVPTGSGAVGDRDVLPAVYARRRENRGFEALAMRPDGRRLWALLQSPLDAPGRSAGKRTGNVRLLAFDPVKGEPVAEHVYRLGDPTSPDFLTRGAPPDDGKLSAMAAVDATRLLVLEQDDGGLARLYLADLAAADDTLGRDLIDGMQLESVADLPAAGIEPVRKTLLADLGSLRRRMQQEVDDGNDGGGALKIEGLAVIDAQHVALVNDNDFGVPQAAAGEARRRTRLWRVELPEALPVTPATAR